MMLPSNMDGEISVTEAVWVHDLIMNVNRLLYSLSISKKKATKPCGFDFDQQNELRNNNTPWIWKLISGIHYCFNKTLALVVSQLSSAKYATQLYK